MLKTVAYAYVLGSILDENDSCAIFVKFIFGKVRAILNGKCVFEGFCRKMLRMPMSWDPILESMLLARFGQNFVGRLYFCDNSGFWNRRCGFEDLC